MANVGDLVQLGISPEVAKHIGDDVVTGIEAAGTTQGTATALTGTINVVETITASSAEGVILVSAENHAKKRVVVINATTSTLTIYPASGETIDGAAANTGLTLPGKRTARLHRISTTGWRSEFDWDTFSSQIATLLAPGINVTMVALSPQNITATSATDITNCSHSVTVTDDDGVFIIGWAEASNGVIDKSTSIRIARGTTNIGTGFGINAESAQTDGRRFKLFAAHYDTPDAGTYTYKLRGWTGTAGSAYFNAAGIATIKVKLS